MTWVVWRQQRSALLSVIALVGLLAVGMVALRLRVSHLLGDLQIAQCLQRGARSCPPEAIDSFIRPFASIGLLRLFLLPLPALVGALLGAPLIARAYEQRAHLFTLTQSCSHRRWPLVSILLVGAPASAAMYLLGLLIAWALSPLEFWFMPILVPGFLTQGLVLGAYFSLAFAAGVTAGIFLRHTVGAIAVSLIVYCIVLVGLGLLRPYYVPPESLRVELSTDVSGGISSPEADVPPYSWILASTFRDSAGREVTLTPAGCKSDSYIDCYKQRGATVQEIQFHPPGHFWALQAIETTLLSALAACALLLGMRHMSGRAL